MNRILTASVFLAVVGIAMVTMGSMAGLALHWVGAESVAVHAVQLAGLLCMATGAGGIVYSNIM